MAPWDIYSHYLMCSMYTYQFNYKHIVSEAHGMYNKVFKISDIQYTEQVRGDRNIILLP